MGAEAGDRALATAREIVRTLRGRLDTRWPVSHQQGWYEAANDLEKFIKEPIQSAMNAQERELREALRQLVGHSRTFKRGYMGAGVLEEHLAEAERLLAERGGTQ